MSSLLDVVDLLCARGFLHAVTRLCVTSKAVKELAPMGTGRQVHDAASAGRDKELAVYLAYWRGNCDSAEVFNWLPSPDADSPLAAAVRFNQLGCVKLLLEFVPSVDVNKGDLCALTWACRLGRAAVVRMLLAATPDIDVNKKGFRGRMPLHWAAENGHAEVVRLLVPVKDIELDAQDVKRWPPLSLALRGKHHEVVAILKETFEKKKEVEQATFAVYDACRIGNVFALAELAKQWRGREEVLSGVDHILGQSPIHVASRNGHVEAVRLLVSIPGVHADKVDRDGRSPLMVSALWGRVEVVRLFLSLQGIDLNRRVHCYWSESHGKTALGMAMQSTGWGAAAWEDKREAAALLRAAGALE